MAGRGLRRILSLILITISIASCDGDVRTGAPATLRFGYDYWPGYYPALIAAEKAISPKRDVDFFLESGGLTRKPDVEQILEPRFLN